MDKTKDFSGIEKYIGECFSKGSVFKEKGEEYKVLRSGKPRPSKGECKTDLYIEAISKQQNKKEFKVSIKMTNHEFLENKISLERAEQILGKNASQIIMDSTKQIKDQFYSELIKLNKKVRGSEDKESLIMLGWKFEITNKQSGHKSSKLLLSASQILDVYAGTNLDKDKQNAKLCGEVVTNSGVANYIMVVSNKKESIDCYANAMQEINEYVHGKELYFTCKAQNYRVEKDKTDLNRPLCVWVKWHIVNNKLEAEIQFDKPLETRANALMDNTRLLLDQLNIRGKLFKDNIKKFYDYIEY
jgi:hypothetical protein